MLKKNCRNRKVVNVDSRLYSPAYDFDGEDGLAQSAFEFFDADAMCFFGVCGPWSYNAWVEATDKYIHEVLENHLKKKVLPRMTAHFKGAPFPQDLQDRINKVDELIKSWDESGYRPTMTQLDKFAHPNPLWWKGQIRNIIDYFDQAACYVDILDEIVVEVLNSPALVVGVPERTLEPAPTGSGSWLDGSGGPSGSGKKSNAGTVTSAIGIMALGAASYFGFKVLTE